MHYVFGPVSSSRLGRSLGIDLLGRKICSFDCLYCEVGPTTRLTRERGPYVPAAAILDELAAWKARAGLTLASQVDHVTLGGSGEPTLNSELPEIILGAKRLFPGVPVAVLTNSSLLDDPATRAELALADAVLPSLDTLVELEFIALNRPHPGIDLSAVAAGLAAFRQEYAGKIYLEILLAAGINDTGENLERLAVFCRGFAAERVDVTTLTRPGAHPAVRAVDRETLAAFQAALHGPSLDATPVAIDAAFRHTLDAKIEKSVDATSETVYHSLLRRPQTSEQLALALGLAPALVEDALAALTADGRALPNPDGFYLATACASRRKAGQR